MKKIKLEGKLSLNKEVILQLNNAQMIQIKGASGDTNCEDTMGDTNCATDTPACLSQDPNCDTGNEDCNTVIMTGNPSGTQLTVCQGNTCPPTFCGNTQSWNTNTPEYAACCA